MGIFKILNLRKIFAVLQHIKEGTLVVWVWECVCEISAALLVCGQSR